MARPSRRARSALPMRPSCGGRARRGAAQALHEAALLVDHHEQRGAHRGGAPDRLEAAQGRRADAAREPTLSREQDDPGRLARGDPPPQPRRRRGAVVGEDHPLADELARRSAPPSGPGCPGSCPGGEPPLWALGRGDQHEQEKRAAGSTTRFNPPAPAPMRSGRSPRRRSPAPRDGPRARRRGRRARSACGQRGGHALARASRYFASRSPDHEGHGHPQLAQPVPHRLPRALSRGRAAPRPGPPAVAQAVGARRLGHLGRLALEERLRAPALGELLDRRAPRSARRARRPRARRASRSTGSAMPGVAATSTRASTRVGMRRARRAARCARPSSSRRARSARAPRRRRRPRTRPGRPAAAPPPRRARAGRARARGSVRREPRDDGDPSCARSG